MTKVQAVDVGRWVLRLVVLCCLALPTIVLAGERTYSVEGKVTGVGTHQETATVGDTLLAHTHRTYTVKAPARIFVLECPNDIGNLIGARECGGKRKIAIGDNLHFRVEKAYAYVQTDPGKEQRLTVLSEDVNEEAGQAAKP